MKILFLSHYFPPEVNAPASRTYEHCVRWARAGHDVTVVTCAPNAPDGVLYPGHRNRMLPQVEWVEGVRVVRVWTYLAANAGTLRRIANFLSYLLSASLAALWLRRPDVVIATSPQFFCGWAGVIVARMKRVPLVLEVRDIWPESIRVVGALKNRFLLRALEGMERAMYRAAAKIVTVGEGYRRHIDEKARLRAPVSVVTNGVDLKQFSPAKRCDQFLRQWNLEHRLVCSYIGTIGMAHGLEVVVEAASQLARAGRRDIVFCLVGDGAARGKLERSVDVLGLGDMVIFLGRQPKEVVPTILSSSDACLVHLKPCELFTTVIPSKIFEMLAMGRPIIMGVPGDAQGIVMEAGAGMPMKPGCAVSLVQAVIKLADDREQTRKLGVNARRYVARHFDRDRLADRLLRILCDVAAGGNGLADVHTAPLSSPISSTKSAPQFFPNVMTAAMDAVEA